MTDKIGMESSMGWYTNGGSTNCKLDLFTLDSLVHGVHHFELQCFSLTKLH
jgi:hypothetical protein